MNPERWATIKHIFDEAMELPPLQQAVFVRTSAGADLGLAAEVMRLLRAHASTAAFLDTPAADIRTYMEAHLDEPSLEAGAVVAGRFEIIRFLNRGGMGEVYEAWDGELKEAVALKTIRLAIASNADVIERFKIEVKQAREISHPNICRVHELFNHDAGGGRRVWFLSMELLRGKTLLERIRTDGPLDPSLAFSVARQLISGLEAAHERGLVHRDFKSSNVILIHGAAGQMRAVITDFGLSLRTLRPEGAPAEPGGMGTPGYRAPEQEEIGEVGPLADQYALGIVFCEMLTGLLPHWSRQISPSATRDADKSREEKLTLVLPGHRFRPRWETVIRRCLQRDPARRFAKVDDVCTALKPPGLLGTPPRIAAAVALLLALAAATLFWYRNHNRCRICDVVQLTPDTDESESPSLSADGHAIVYSSDRADTGNLDIFYQRLPNGRPQRLTTHPARDDDPTISPDGGTVAFRSERDNGGIYIVHTDGQPEHLLVPHGRQPRISPDGKSLLYWTGDADTGIASGKIFVMPLTGGPPVQIASSFADARLPIWSPDSRAIIFSGCDAGEKTLPGCTEWWAVSTDGKRIVNTGVLAKLRGNGLVLARPGASFWYTGGLLFSCGVQGLKTSLSTIKLDPQTWRVAGSPTQLLNEAGRDLSPSLSTDRAIAYTRQSGALHVWRLDHASQPGAAVLAKVTDDAEVDGSPFISEGGRFLVFGRGRGAKRSIWIRDNSAASETMLVSSGAPVQSPVINRSGDLLVYEQTEQGAANIYIRPLGAPAPKQLCHGCSQPSGWFDTDKAFFYRDETPAVIRMADPRTGAISPVLEEPGAALGDASWSPANEFLLFTETKNDRKRIFAVRLPRSSGRREGKWISIPDNGIAPEHPRWSGDGRTIFYISNGDGFPCIYGQAFSPEKGEVVGSPYAVAHFHNQRANIDNVFAEWLRLSVDGDSVYFNLGEQSSTVWLGSLSTR